MEEYTQMTLNDWIKIKKGIRMELQSVKNSFVRLGYLLRKAQDGKFYESEGYKSIGEFALNEFGLTPSVTSRLIKINAMYSLGGYGERLDPKYEGFNKSQLEEMLQLPECDRELIDQSTPRQTIRDLKNFNKEAGKEEGHETDQDKDDEITELVVSFLEQNREEYKELRKYFGSGETISDMKEKEILNPSGSKTFKKGLLFLMLTETKVSVKKFGEGQQSFTWEEFHEILKKAIEKVVEQPEKVIEFPKAAVESPKEEPAEEEPAKEEPSKEETTEETPEESEEEVPKEIEEAEEKTPIEEESEEVEAPPAEEPEEVEVVEVAEVVEAQERQEPEPIAPAQINKESAEKDLNDASELRQINANGNKAIYDLKRKVLEFKRLMISRGHDIKEYKEITDAIKQADKAFNEVRKLIKEEIEKIEEEK